MHNIRYFVSISEGHVDSFQNEILTSQIKANQACKVSGRLQKCVEGFLNLFDFFHGTSPVQRTLADSVLLR